MHIKRNLQYLVKKNHQKLKEYNRTLATKVVQERNLTMNTIENVYQSTRSGLEAKTAKDETGTLIAAGITGIFLFHVVENIGMVMGLLPITGVTLPFISYGGSSLITNFICIGILLNISSKRQKTIFVK